jgi:predicted rRNA pseudouridine synthase
MLGVPRAGHAGTLDPSVSGILVIAVGKALRVLPLLLDFPKRYVGLIQLHGSVRSEDLVKVLHEFQGDIYQLPPVRSAVKRERRVRRIHKIRLIERTGNLALVDVTCESGTYIRTLAVDVGEALGVGAHLAELRRVASGPFTEKEAVNLSTISDAVATASQGDMTALSAILQPPSRVWKEVPAVVVKDTAVDAIAHGADLAVAGIVRVTKPFAKGDHVVVVTKNEELLAIGRAIVDSTTMMEADKGWVVDTIKVFIPPGQYPQTWGKKKHKDNE